ncbi:MAG TPA: hypothetical protein VLG14_10320 [Sphingomonas sp.]|nr:hypothetical protein [Sphingomonas sp.]
MNPASPIAEVDGYRAALGLGLGERGLARREAALKRAYELRSFEIELFWKRATFFFAGQVAIFAALAVMIRFDQMQSFYALPVALLGVCTAWLGWRSAQGAKFWQQNWERHIDILEDDIEGRLHKIVWLGADGPSYSVSRAQIYQSLCLLSFWLIMAGVVAFRLLAPIEPSVAGRAVMLIVVAGYYAVIQDWARGNLVSGLDRNPTSFVVRAFPGAGIP